MKTGFSSFVPICAQNESAGHRVFLTGMVATQMPESFLARVMSEAPVIYAVRHVGSENKGVSGVNQRGAELYAWFGESFPGMSRAHRRTFVSLARTFSTPHSCRPADLRIVIDNARSY